VEVVYETKRLLLYVFDDSHLESVKKFWGDEEVTKHANTACVAKPVPQDSVYK